MFTRRTDLQLERDSLGRFLPWLIAFMVYLSVLAFAGMLALDDVATRWDRGMSGSLTVQMVSVDSGGEKQATAVLKVLNSTPGISSAQFLNPDKLMVLLEPWLGSDALVAELPLPRLVDVTLESGTKINIAALERRLIAVAPGAIVDDHGIWLEHLINLIQSVKALALAVLVFIVLATIGTVIFATRTGLAIHHEAIEVLHLIGAQDSYIARQFASRALMLGLRGGILGLMLAVPTIWGIGTLARSLQAGFLPEFSLGPPHWVVLGSLPVVVALVAMVSARLTVIKTLARML